MSWEAFFGYLTGLRFVSADIDLATLLRTAVVVNTCNAIVCRLIASNNGMHRGRWTVIGFALGFWAVAAALVLSSTGLFRDHEGGR